MRRYIYDLMTKALYLNKFHPQKKYDVIGVTKLSRSKIPVSDLMEQKIIPEKCCNVLDGDTVDGRNPR